MLDETECSPDRGWKHRLTSLQLFRHFNWALVNPEKPWRLFNSNGIFVINDLWVQVTPREVRN
jgi:hypothetical protein